MEGLQRFVREHCRLARRFESHVRKDSRFEVASPVNLGLVCFRWGETVLVMAVAGFLLFSYSLSSRSPSLTHSDCFCPFFRLRGSNHINQKLLSSINASGKLHMVPASLNDKYVIRFCVVSKTATDEDIGESPLTWSRFLKFTSAGFDGGLLKMKGSSCVGVIRVSVCVCVCSASY